MSSPNVKIEETQTDQIQNDHEDTGSEDEVEVQDEAAAEPSTSAPKKKKKKKSKASRVLNALRSKEQIPQEIVDTVLNKVQVEHGENAPGVDEATVRATLEQLKIMDVMKGKSGIGGINKKDIGDHKFWGTQPVTQPGEEVPEEDGFIEPSKPREEVRQDPYPLPKEFEWSTLDMSDPNQTKEVYDLLSLNYIEDDEASFRFLYTAEFLEWALKPPGYFKEWHVGVRVASNKKLVAFISGVPISLRVRDKIILASEINYLCVHKKLRSKRLTPVLIKEVTRQVHLKGIFQAIYTAGIVLPTPVSTCRYYHRSLNVPKLVDIRFCYVPRNMTLARMIKLNKLPSTPQLLEKGLREMEDRDVEQVSSLFTRYMKRFGMAPEMTLAEVKHQFLSGRGDLSKTLESKWKGRRDGQVVWTFVVENPNTHAITDFFSFYSLPSTIINDQKHAVLESAYLFYYATDVAFQEGAEDTGLLKRRVQELINDALIVADQAKFDVFNALTLMDNVPILQDLKFGVGDGFLNFYLYNWRTKPFAGLNGVDGVPPGKGIGVVML
ncbi:glycylpeptide N-tetradecanoyltransferase [Pleurotus pulmonarius]|nr:glycylpeptide N-tetradecanoyltransferase [Pleurotus pulmonarius]KAF4608646.1 glycylpeptide N-tetradecanoyltransferase [Pleurotus pulmonarius]